MSTRIFTNTGGAPQQADGEDKEVHNRRGPGCPLPSGAVVPGQPLDTERLPPRRHFCGVVRGGKRRVHDVRPPTARGRDKKTDLA